MGTSEPVSSPDKGEELGCGDPCRIQPRIHMRTRNKDYSAMERTYSRSQCDGSRAAVPAIAPPGPGGIHLTFMGQTFLTMLLKKCLSHIDLLLVLIHSSFCIFLQISFLLLENEAACCMTQGTPFFSHKLHGSSSTALQEQICNSTAKPNNDAQKVCFRTIFRGGL